MDYLRDHTDGTALAIPTFDDSDRKTPDQLRQALTQLVNLFVMSGFSWEGKVQEEGRGDSAIVAAAAVESRVQPDLRPHTFCLTLTNPATVWSAQCLAQQKAPLRNDYLLKTARQLARSMGFTVVSSKVKMEGDDERSYLTILM